ncbi:AAA family ATPase [Bacillus altitudinis]|uniref:AAA family ATPase n=1 Tax=Bacillus altitudinis TaxID=293387 RepID=UPI00045C4742|nr:AAA family ATPase [Bacillus altitudinis]KDE31590.1 DNA replication protein, phage related [Bacillus altitudinis 41KF2b]MEC1043177.1 AAA family ATPase [Bacillus altitudinis]MEC1092471.1 AAA family ATPase [Bacillus altitudinis]
MQSIKSVAAEALNARMTFHSDYCNKHTFTRGSEDVVKPVRMMILNGKVVCPRCELEANEKKLQRDLESQIEFSQRTKNFNMLEKHSMFRDKTIAQATFDNYKVAEREETANKGRTMELVGYLKQGEVFNTFLQGHPGVGKSHLAYAALKALNVPPDPDDPKDMGKSCLFINMEEAASAIKDTFSNKESKYTESYVTQLMGDADYLVIDDLGAETGSEHSDSRASDFIHRLIYKVTSARQDKATIYTTNLTSKKLYQMYDSKLVSRIMQKQQYIVFKETSDKREMELPF